MLYELKYYNVLNLLLTLLLFKNLNIYNIKFKKCISIRE